MAVFEARFISEQEKIINLDDKKESASLKTHEEILNLFEEIETIEKNMIKPDITDDDLTEPQTDIPTMPPEKIKDSTKKEYKIEETPDNIKKSMDKTYLKHHKKEKIKKPKTKKHLLKFKKQRENKLIDNKSSELTEEKIKTKQINENDRSTFTLKLDKKGNLIGLNIKQPKEKIKIKTAVKGLIKRKPSEDKNEPSPDIKLKEIKGITGKIKALPKVIKSKIPSGKRNEDNKEVGLSKIVGKIKGIFSRK